MSVTHTNFKGEPYYLHSRKTKKGNDTYHFSKKREGAFDGDIPVGFEIYEEPNGKVYLRKKLKQLVRNDEIKQIEQGMKKYCNIKDFKLDVKKDTVFVYTVTKSIGHISEFASMFTNDFDDSKYKDYETNLRFILTDEEARNFIVERMYYGGAEEEWMFIDSSDELAALVKEYAPHLGEESFYELI